MTTPTNFFEDEINLCNEHITSIEHIMHGEMRIADEDSTALPMRRADWQRYRDALTRWDQQLNGHAHSRLILEWQEIGGPPAPNGIAHYRARTQGQRYRRTRR